MDAFGPINKLVGGAAIVGGAVSHFAQEKEKIALAKEAQESQDASEMAEIQSKVDVATLRQFEDPKASEKDKSESREFARQMSIGADLGINPQRYDETKSFLANDTYRNQVLGRAKQDKLFRQRLLRYSSEDIEAVWPNRMRKGEFEEASK